MIPESLHVVLTACGVLGSIIAWFVADAASKARSEVALKQLEMVVNKNSYLELQMARSEQDRKELHASCERLEATKASKEMADANTKQLERFMEEIDRRFDRLEKIIAEKI
jgi:hypothetical protein